MSYLPGQRTAQRPLRAAIATQRALGRAAATAGGGLATRMVLDIADRRWAVETGGDGQQVWTDQTTGVRYVGGPDGEEATG